MTPYYLSLLWNECLWLQMMLMLKAVSLFSDQIYLSSSLSSSFLLLCGLVFLDVKQNFSSVVISHNKTFTCSTENSGHCSYKWHAKIRSDHPLEANEGSTMTIHRPGQYYCTAICTLHRNTCTVTPLFVNFISPGTIVSLFIDQ